MNRKACARLTATGALKVEPSRVGLLRLIGDRRVLTGTLELLSGLADANPHLSFADLWHGYCRYV